MNKIIVWSNENPVLAIIGAGAIITALVLIVRAIINAGKNTETNPANPNTQKAGSQLIYPIVNTVIGSGGRPSGGVGNGGIGAGGVGGVGGGMVGARVSQGNAR